MSTDAAQLTLPVYLRDDATLENFLFHGGLGALSRALERRSTPGGEALIYLHGPEGSGRSHLLQAACHASQAGDALYLPLAQLREEDAAVVLAGVENLSDVSLDDLHAIAGRADWELALFHLVNRARESGCRLLLSADCAPRRLPLELPDLRSRLSGGMVFQLPVPGDADKLRILRFRAQRRGMKLTEEVGRYILSRSPRGMKDLMTVLEQLDRDSITARRALTVPFVKEQMGW